MRKYQSYATSCNHSGNIFPYFDVSPKLGSIFVNDDDVKCE